MNAIDSTWTALAEAAPTTIGNCISAALIGLACWAHRRLYTNANKREDMNDNHTNDNDTEGPAA